MKALRSTDYFAVIVVAGLPCPGIPRQVSDTAFHQRIVADFSLLALMLFASISVATVVLNWSH